MNPEIIKTVAQYFVDARRSGTGLPLLPPELRPKTTEECHAIQDATVALLNEPIGGWKVSIDPTGVMTRAPIFRHSMFTSPARVPAAMSPLGIEAEIAFRFLYALPARQRDYSREQVIEAMDAFTAIELLNTRYADSSRASVLDKVADFAINGGIVCAQSLPNWRAIDFRSLEVILTLDGQEAVRTTGAYPGGDPVAPAVALVNALRTSTGVEAGQIMTTGSWTGVTQIHQSRVAIVQFRGFPAATSEFVP